MCGSSSSCLTCCLLFRWQVLCGGAKDNSTAIPGKGWGSLNLSQTSAAPNIKTERAQRIVDDVTPWTWSTTSTNPLLVYSWSQVICYRCTKMQDQFREHFFPLIPVNLGDLSCCLLMPTVATFTPWNFLLLEKKLWQTWNRNSSSWYQKQIISTKGLY